MAAAGKERRKWQRRVAKGLPALSVRVFALREVMYPGCGFHYGMERSLGRVIALANDYDRRFDVADAIIDQVLVESLYREVAAAEASSLIRADRATEVTKEK